MQASSLKILVVEDIRIALKMALIVLEELGCVVDTANSGILSLELIKQNHYDVIFMDLGLPDIDGLTLTETIRKIKEEDTHHDQKTLIIALTAHGESLKEDCLQAGMDDFIEKPLTKEASLDIFKKYHLQKQISEQPLSP